MQNSQPSPTKLPNDPVKDGGRVEASMEAGEVDDYDGDDWDLEESAKPQPATNLRQGAAADDRGERDPQVKTRTDLMDINASASASLLPPLHSGGAGGSRLLDNYQSQ